MLSPLEKCLAGRLPEQTSAAAAVAILIMSVFLVKWGGQGSLRDCRMGVITSTFPPE